MSRSRETNSDPWSTRIVTNGFADALQGQHDVLASIAKTRINGRREATEGVDDGEHTDLATGGELVVNEIHGPGVIDLTCFRPILAQLGLDPTLRRLVTQLQA